MDQPIDRTDVALLIRMLEVPAGKVTVTSPGGTGNVMVFVYVPLVGSEQYIMVLTKWFVELEVSCALTRITPFFNVPMVVVEPIPAETIVPRVELYPTLAWTRPSEFELNENVSPPSEAKKLPFRFSV